MKTFYHTLYAILISTTTAFSQSIEHSHEDGNRTVYTYQDGMIAFETFTSEGLLFETGYFLDGRPHGNWVRFDEQGEVAAQASYNFGDKDGRWLVWNHDRTILFEINYQQNEKISAVKWRADERIAAAVTE
jgi:antitoxin component YwqK of YwqJK toxin-antitoxin module